jgi:4-amino-4-deoxy-L-arabinose transferase-like glycosyltransferase
MKRNSERFISLLLLALLILGLGLRLYDLTDQPIDFHPTRQLRGAIVARGMYYEMWPQADPETRQQAMAFWQSTGQYEPSILERLVALTYLAVSGEYIWIARIYTSLFWIIGGIVLYALARRMLERPVLRNEGTESGRRETTDILYPQDNSAWWIPPVSALIVLAYYLVLPFAVQASRSFQPDPGMVMWLALFAYSLYRWSEAATWKWAFLTGALGGMAVLTKAVAAYIVAGATIALLLYTLRRLPQGTKGALPAGHSLFAFPAQVLCMGILMVAPTAIYYLGRGGRASEYFSSWTLALSHLLLEPTFYLRWLNLVQSLMGPIPLLLGIVGTIIARGRGRALLLGLWIGYILYGLFLPYQMYTHSYYNLQVVFLLALSLAPVAQFALERLVRLSHQTALRTSHFAHRAFSIALAGTALLILAYFAWISTAPMRAEDYRGEPAYWQQIASYLPTDGKIMALTQDYGYRLMYYGWRKVTLWPNRGEQKLSQLRGSDKEFENLFAKHTEGKSYFLITAFKQFEDQPDLKQYLYDRYPLLAEGQGYLIFNLTRPKI